MNNGKRQVRNTALGMYGIVILFVGVNRLYAAVLDADAPGWVQDVASLGLRKEGPQEAEPVMRLAEARDFKGLLVVGRFSVEVAGAPAWKVTATRADGSEAPVRASVRDGTLHLIGIDSASVEAGEFRPVATVRIEMPALERVDARVPELSISGMSGDAVQVTGLAAGVIRLQQNSVANWRLYSGTQVQVQVDDATFAAGNIRAIGNVSISRDP